MNIIKYLFSDRKALPFWAFIFVIIFCYHGLQVIMEYSKENGLILKFLNFHLFIIFFVVFIGFYLGSYWNYMSFKRFKKYLDKKQIKYTLGNSNVEIFQSSFTVKPLKFNHDAEINIKPKFEIFRYIKTETTLVLFGQIYEFGLFRKHLKPFGISLDNRETKETNFQINTIKTNEVHKVEKDIIISFKRNKNGLYKLKLLNIEGVIK